jgi:hypothetical protein
LLVKKGQKGVAAMGDPFTMNEPMFQIVPIFIGIIFVIVIGSIVVSAFRGIGEWNKNEQSPRLSVPAAVKSKRTDVRRSSNVHANDTLPHSSSSHTKYFVTFEFESGDRQEFHVSGKEFGLLVEGDSGTLTFQGSRYLGFDREKVKHEST